MDGPLNPSKRTPRFDELSEPEPYSPPIIAAQG
jgi:hypothetical protein